MAFTSRPCRAFGTARRRALDARDWWVRPDGIKVARWARLAFDLAADLELRDHTSVVHQMLDRKLVDLAELHAIGSSPGSSRPAREHDLRSHDGVHSATVVVHQSDPEVGSLADLRSQACPSKPRSH